MDLQIYSRAITFLSLQIGQWYLVCRCIIMRRCVMYQHDQTHFKNINYLTLKSKVKLRSRWNTAHCLMIIHGTPTYQISLIYRKKQKGYDSDTITLKKYQFFDLNVSRTIMITVWPWPLTLRSNILLERFMNGRHGF
jgi:hypothetical protein